MWSFSKIYLVKLVSLVALVIVFQNCQSESRIDAYPVALQKITGKWEAFAYRTTGQSRWIADTTHQMIRFRYDGLLLDELNEPVCCVPSSYIINKDTVDVSKKDSFKPNDNCFLVDCELLCSYFHLRVLRDTLVIDYCQGESRKFLRIK